MEYMLLLHLDEKAMQNSTQEEFGKRFAAYTAYTEAMKQAGIWRAGSPLQGTATATTVRVKDGKSSVLNGPYAEVKEQLGGYYLIDAPDLDAALSWAARCPAAADGAVEVRPVWAM